MLVSLVGLALGLMLHLTWHRWFARPSSPGPVSGRWRRRGARVIGRRTPTTQRAHTWASGRFTGVALTRGLTRRRRTRSG